MELLAYVNNNKEYVAFHSDDLSKIKILNLKVLINKYIELLNDSTKSFDFKFEMVFSYKKLWNKVIEEFEHYIGKLKTIVVFEVFQYLNGRRDMEKLDVFFKDGYFLRFKNESEKFVFIENSLYKKLLEIFYLEFCLRIYDLINFKNNYLESLLNNNLIIEEAKKFKVKLYRKNSFIKKIRFNIYNNKMNNSLEKKLIINTSYMTYDKNWHYVENEFLEDCKNNFTDNFNLNVLEFRRDNNKCFFNNTDIEKYRKIGIRFIIVTIYINKIINMYLTSSIESTLYEEFEKYINKKKYELDFNSKISLPIIFDIENENFFLTDIKLNSKSAVYNYLISRKNMYSFEKGLSKHDLFLLHGFFINFINKPVMGELKE